MGLEKKVSWRRTELLGSFAFFGIIATFAALTSFAAAFCVVTAAFTTAVMIAMSTTAGREKSK
jgi:hypothetical protein